VYIRENESQGISDYLEVEYLEGDQLFKALGSYVGNVIIQTTGTNQHPEGSFNVRIMPNPAQDKVFVCIDDEKYKDGVIKIYQITGQLVKTCMLSDNKTEINVGDLVKGVYILNVETENGSINLRVIKN
nr:T9SS type A sorting domain-containing protein [Bacteroidota bacterium]